MQLATNILIIFYETTTSNIIFDHFFRMKKNVNSLNILNSFTRDVGYNISTRLESRAYMRWKLTTTHTSLQISQCISYVRIYRKTT